MACILFAMPTKIAASQLKPGQSFYLNGALCRCVCVYSATVEIETTGNTKISFIFGEEEVTIVPE